MLPKKNRVDKKGIDLLFKQSKLITSPSLTFKFILTEKNSVKKSPQISFIVPKNVAKLAVKRNTLRRRGYTALGPYISQFPPNILGAFVFKKYQDDISILEDEIKKILSKIN
ncbi:MAG TPA: ribonuclease P protein component [Candidatus Paceibacterota bacterium]|jgi:hypothetical protein|nr:ribonuclease P protein component [Candidatus Paceibacterota bacterium]